MRILVIGCVLVALAGCASSQDQPQDGLSGPATKVVTHKVVPTTLIAADGTLCTVSALRFQDTSIGDTFFCAWRRRGEGPPRPR